MNFAFESKLLLRNQELLAVLGIIFCAGFSGKQRPVRCDNFMNFQPNSYPWEKNP